MIHYVTSNDTIVLNDSIVNKMAKSTNIVMSSVNDSMSNWADVQIARCISCTIVFVVLICVVGYVILKICETKSNRTKEENKRAWDKEDRNSKQKSDLLNRKLEILKELCDEPKIREEVKDDIKSEKWVKELRGLASNEIIKYLSEIDSAITSFDVIKQ